MANADRCVCCGEIIPEGSHICPNCKAAVNRETGMEAYTYLAKYTKENVPKKPKPKKKDLVEVVRCKDCKHFGGYGACHCHAADENGTPIFVRENDFCSYGERKDNE